MDPTLDGNVDGADAVIDAAGDEQVGALLIVLCFNHA